MRVCLSSSKLLLPGCVQGREWTLCLVLVQQERKSWTWAWRAARTKDHHGGHVLSCLLRTLILSQELLLPDASHGVPRGPVFAASMLHAVDNYVG